MVGTASSRGRPLRVCEPVAGAAERDAVGGYVFASVLVGDEVVDDEPVGVAAVDAPMVVAGHDVFAELLPPAGREGRGAPGSSGGCAGRRAAACRNGTAGWVSGLGGHHSRAGARPEGIRQAAPPARSRIVTYEGGERGLRPDVISGRDLPRPGRRPLRRAAARWARCGGPDNAAPEASALALAPLPPTRPWLRRHGIRESPYLRIAVAACASASGLEPHGFARQGRGREGDCVQAPSLYGAGEEPRRPSPQETSKGRAPGCEPPEILGRGRKSPLVPGGPLPRLWRTHRPGTNQCPTGLMGPQGAGSRQFPRTVVRHPGP